MLYIATDHMSDRSRSNEPLRYLSYNLDIIYSASIICTLLKEVYTYVMQLCACVTVWLSPCMHGLYVMHFPEVKLTMIMHNR